MPSTNLKPDCAILTEPDWAGQPMPELFETFDRTGRPLGLAPRDRVHREGLWHKSAHVFLFDHAGSFIVQRRAADKDLYAELWDYSVGEHLKPGEGYEAGATRGLQEELGITGVVLRAVGEERASSFTEAHRAICDQEFQQAFTAIYSGDVYPDPGEVAEVRRVSPRELERWLAQAPEQFTPWFMRDVHELGLLA